jgi:insulysin
VTHGHLSEALDRFSSFFKCPLFTPSCIDRELTAVNNENSKNLQADSWRAFQLLKSTSNPLHPFSKFGTGNHATLRDAPREAGVDVRAALLDFHANYYSPRIMALAVVGRESLEQLEALVAEKFGPVAAAEQSANAQPVFGSDAMTAAQLGRLIRAVPVKDLRYVQLLWHIDAPVHHLFDTKPLELASHCLGHVHESIVTSRARAVVFGDCA